MLLAIEGHLISGYQDGGDIPDKHLELVPGAITDADAFLAEDAAVRERVDRVGRLVEGFETPFGLELLATVHWVVTQERVSDPQDLVTKVYAWNDRKRRFSQRQIHIAYEALRSNGWFLKAQH